ncbi:MAG: DUF5719 family protein [Chloroflexota bacterium]
MQLSRDFSPGLLAAVVTIALLFCVPDSQRMSAIEAAPAQRLVQSVPLASAELLGITALDGGYVLTGELRDVPAYAPFTQVGILITVPVDSGGPIGAVQSHVRGGVPEDGALEVEVRGSVDGVVWSSWSPSGAAVFPFAVRFLQHRVTLLARSESPMFTALETVTQPGVAMMTALQAKASPTVKVFGSREGLIGRKTANGHTITATDRFVALPSRRVLNPLGKTDYRVRITYQDRSVEAPVWDVGPWNIKDNYWDENRESFTDLPRFVPQAFAAWAENHNGGKDGTGRWVSFPASIDISDAAFIEDLKLRESSWVDVTFLWLEAASPPVGPTPPVLGLKPFGSKGMQPGVLPPGSPTSASTTGPAQVNESQRPPAPLALAPATAPAMARPYALHLAYVPVDAGVDSWIVMQNLGDQPANAVLRFARVDGQRETRDIIVAPNARFAVSASTLVSSGEYSVEIGSDRPLVAERSIYLGADAVSASAIVSPSRTWFFPEGSTEAPQETLVALANPGSRDALATLTFFGDRGQIRTSDVRLARGARVLVNLAELVPPGSVSTVVESDQPLVAERLTFMNNRAAGDGLAGSVSASTSWSFSDANTTPGSDAWLILLNPTDLDATVQARLMGVSGPIGERTYSVSARSRSAIYLNDDVPESRFGIVLNTDQPIVAERAEFVRENGSAVASVSVMGTTDAATSWAFPEGASPSAQSETIALLNAGERTAVTRLELIGEKGRVTTREVRIAPLSTSVFDVPRDASESTLSIRVISDRPVTVERQIRFGAGRGATGSSGIRL